MDYKPLDQIGEEELVQSFDIRFTSVYELEQELRHYGRREAELVRKAMQATKNFNRKLAFLKIKEAELIAKIKRDAVVEGKPIAPSAFGEIRKSMVAKEKEWQIAQKDATEAQAQSDLWNGLLAAWKSRGFRLQELAKIAERTLWNDPIVKEESGRFLEDRGTINLSSSRTKEGKIESKLSAQNNLQFD